MPRVLRRPLAEADTLGIWDYIAEDNVAAADRWVDRLDEQFTLLATQPLIGRSQDELGPGIRSFPFQRYVVVYVAKNRAPMRALPGRGCMRDMTGIAKRMMLGTLARQLLTRYA